MTIGAVYASDLSRVRIECTGAPAMADYALIERSVDQIRWVAVRGGAAVPLVAAACQLDDYEFVTGQTNYYRARYVDTANPGLPALGTVATAVNANVTPGLPAGLQANDIMLLLASIRNTAGSVNTPAGWNLLVDGGNMRLFTRVWQPGDVAPTVTFTGGVAGADTIARIGMVRNADFTLTPTAVQSNASAQNIDAPALAASPLTPNLLLRIAWKQSTSTMSAMTGGWVAYSRDAATTGDDSTQLWWSKITSDDEPVGTFVMTGGVAAVSKSASVRITRKAYISQETASVLPTITDLWLKNIAKPFLNRKIVVTDYSTITQPSRSGSFPITGRRAEVAVTDVRGGNRYTITVRTNTAADAADLKSVLALGDTVLLHVPHDYQGMPGGYYLIGDLSTDRALLSDRSERRYHQLPMQEVAAPSDSVVGTTVVWQNIISSFATWGDLIAAEPTWGDVMDRVGTPSDVVVP